MKPGSHASETLERVVRASRADARKWLADAPVCAALAQHGIVHVGVAEVAHPYEVRRPDLSGTFVMICTHGEGRVWLEGKWQPMRAGMACLAPPHAFHAYRALPRKSWLIAWVRYQEPDGALPLVNARAPILSSFDGGPLTAAIEGLHGEASGTASPAAMQLWADLIQHYARTFAEPWRTDDRLRDVWQSVVRDLAAEWSLTKLAKLAGMSAKHFSRLCQQSLGRTPAQHITALRLQQAAFLLTTTSDKVETIARQVGYHSLFTFSHAFKKFTGNRPSEYRKR
ncbi:MAG TPA: AraC family transcriptional regulator [Prosthecobacter sp.]|nr:AraC family transcriptional regulator [Prosthecobacter sp.]